MAWAKTVLPDPLQGLWENIKDMPEPIQKRLLDNAEKRASLRGTSNDPDAMNLLQSPEGIKKILCLLFQKHQPYMTEDEIMDVVEQGWEELGDTAFVRFFPDSTGGAGPGRKPNHGPVPSRAKR
jgi:hypothetical protein